MAITVTIRLRVNVLMRNRNYCLWGLLGCLVVLLSSCTSLWGGDHHGTLHDSDKDYQHYAVTKRLIVRDSQSQLTFTDRYPVSSDLVTGNMQKQPPSLIPPGNSGSEKPQS